MKKISLIILVLFSFFFGLVAHAAPGIVLSVQDGAWAVRNGEKVKLAVKNEIFVGDELITDANGKLQILFEDDTAISLGSDTQVAVSDFIFGDSVKKPSFSAGVAQGAARFVTGKVVEQNRSGFSVSTPQATVGIRGTTFMVNVSDKGVTSVIGLNVNSAFPISVTNSKTGAVNVISKSGMAVDAAPSGNSSYQTPPGQFSQSSSAVNGSTKAQASSSSNSTQSTAAAPPQGANSTAVTGTPPTAAALSASAASMASSTLPLIISASLSEPAAAQDLMNSRDKSSDQILADLGVNTGVNNDNSSSNNSGSTTTPPVITPPTVTPPVIPGLEPSSLVGSYTGEVFNSATGYYSQVGTFQFYVNLNAGNAEMKYARINISSGYGTGMQASQEGQSFINNGNFHTNLSVDNAAGTVATVGPNYGASYMKGSITPHSHDVDGKWHVEGLYPGETTLNGMKN